MLRPAVLALLPLLAATRFGAPRAARAPTLGAAGPAAAALHDSTPTTLWPAPVSDSRAANCKWAQVGADGEAATSADCPYTAHGPDGSLAACQQACVSAGAQLCTDINFSPSVPDCVFRRCADPQRPNLTAAPGYAVYVVQRPAIAAHALRPGFGFVLAPGSRSGAGLAAALARAPAQAFPYGAGAPSSLPGPALAQLLVTGAGDDDELRLGVDESYAIDVSAAGAALSAATVFGAMRGLETFAQLVAYNLSDGSYSLEAAAIRDAPRFPYRGLMIDTSRHFISVTVMKQIVAMMAAVKLNTLSIHFNDDNSWPLFIESFPQLSLQGAYSNSSHTYAPAQMRDLVAFAAGLGVRVLPEFDSPSHFGTLAASYPQFAAATKDGGACMVDPSREEVFDFLAAVWRDIAAMFPDAQFRIGGDEFQGCWADCPAVMSWIAQQFGANGTIYDAYHYYVRRVVGIQRALKKAPMAWLDVEGFPDKRAGETWGANYSDVTLNVWTGCYSGDWQADVARFVKENGTVVVSGPFYITDAAAPHFTVRGGEGGGGGRAYLSPHTHASLPLSPHPQWEQMYMVDLSNFTGSNATAAQARVSGGEVCAWDDAAGTDAGDLAMQITPYILGVAEAWWSPRAATSGKAPDAMRAHHQRCRLGQRGFATHPIFAFGTFCPMEFEAQAFA